jgi:hypothetical protein
MPPVVRLRKAIYGLPQAAKLFRDHSDAVLKEIGFIRSKSDSCLYIYTHDNGQSSFACVHVDDIGLATPDMETTQYFHQQFKRFYDITFDADMTTYLGCHIVRDRVLGTLQMNQQSKIEDFISTYDLTVPTVLPSIPMKDMRLINLPVSTNNPILDAEGIHTYMSKVGAINYIANSTRPDILFSSSQLSRFLQRPTQHHMAAVDEIIYYLLGTSTLGLTFRSGEVGLTLHGTVDASYASHPDMKSHTGFTVHLVPGSAAVIARSKKQTIVADSSTYSEWIAAHSASHYIVWARSLLSEMGFTQHTPTTLYEDNKSTIALLNQPSNANRTKHVAIRFSYLRERIEEKEITMEYLKTEDMISDILTKPLARIPFVHLRDLLLGTI